MIALPRTMRYRVADLMEQFGMDIQEFASETGLDEYVLSAMAHQRYTPSPEQRRRVSAAFGLSVDQIIWGHRTLVEDYVRGPL